VDLRSAEEKGNINSISWSSLKSMSETLPPACLLSVCQVYVQLLVKSKSYLYFVNVHVNSKSENCIGRAGGLWLHALQLPQAKSMR